MRRCETCEEWGSDVRVCASCRYPTHEACDPGFSWDPAGEFICAGCTENYRLPTTVEEIVHD